MSAHYQLLAAHPALDFVNTLDDRFTAMGPRELLNDYADVLAFTQQSELIEARQAAALASRCASVPAARVFKRTRELREALATVVYGSVDHDRKPPGDCLELLQREFKDAQNHQELAWRRMSNHGEVAWQWGRFESELELPLWALARSALGLLTSAALQRVHACGSETCRWVFLDTSKNHSRRWCDMKICGNRMKARRFQARQ
jgi:predicted RNA-binding Zn ribbon-like protein